MPIILLVIGIVLIIYNYRAMKKDGTIEIKNTGKSFDSILEVNKEGLNDYKMEIGILRRDIAESLTELQEEIIDIKNNLNKLKNNDRVYENKNELEYVSYEKNDDNFMETIHEENIHSQVYHNNDLKDNNEFYDELNNEENIIADADFEDDNDSDKTHKIKILLEEGLTEEEICHKLSVSKGEVLLVKGLFKK